MDIDKGSAYQLAVLFLFSTFSPLPETLSSATLHRSSRRRSISCKPIPLTMSEEDEDEARRSDASLEGLCLDDRRPMEQEELSFLLNVFFRVILEAYKGISEQYVWRDVR